MTVIMLIFVLIFEHLDILSHEIAETFSVSLGTTALLVVSITLRFMFVARTRFPVKHSIVDVLRKCYGKILVKNVRKTEKCDFKHKKAIWDLNFLFTCKGKNTIPKFLRFKIANRQLLQFSNTYTNCLNRLLNQIISNKHSPTCLKLQSRI